MGSITAAAASPDSTAKNTKRRFIAVLPWSQPNAFLLGAPAQDNLHFTTRRNRLNCARGVA
jgi:hypothetical protein